MALKPSDILALSKAGYNSAQIALIAQGVQAEAAAEPTAVPASAPAPTQQAAEPAPAPTQQAAEPAPAPAPTYDGIMAELQKISGAMFAGNIANSQQPAQQTPEDIIAAIIRPPQPADK